MIEEKIVSEIMDHLAQLSGNLVAYEKNLESATVRYLKERRLYCPGNSPCKDEHENCSHSAIILGNGTTLTYEQLAENLLVLHYHNIKPDENILIWPVKYKERIREIIIQKRKILMKLLVPFEKASPEIEQWLKAT